MKSNYSSPFDIGNSVIKYKTPGSVFVVYFPVSEGEVSSVSSSILRLAIILNYPNKDT